MNQAAHALRLGGAAAAELDAVAIDLSGIASWSALLERCFGQARAVLGEAAATAAWKEGRHTGFDYAVSLALDSDATEPIGYRAA